MEEFGPETGSLVANFPMRRTVLILGGAALAFLAVAVGPSLLGGGGGGLGLGLDFQGAMDRGILLAAGVVFLGGVLTSLTPCVYPLIPVTVAIFGAREGQSRLRSMALSTMYVLGMAVMYAALGLMAAMTGRLLGSMMTNVWIMGGVALILFVFAASFLGAFEIRLPTSLQMRLSRIGGEGYFGAFAMGLVAGLIAAPCTGPVLGGVLAYVAASQDVVLGATLLFVFAIGMGLLFWVIGTFSVSLPKGGPWMDAVKSIFAVAMLVVALWFLKDAVRPIRAVLVSADWVPLATGIAVAVGILIGGIHRSFQAGARDRVLKGAGLVLLVGGLFLRVGGLTVVGAAERDAVAWIHDEREGLAAAEEAQRPVFIDFRADWCTACIELERHTFPHPDVAEEAERFVAVKIDATYDDDPEIQRLLEKYRINGLPTVVFLDSEGNERSDLRVERFVPPRDMLRRMRDVE
jgi:thioredoxin:protein disulfide reductase